MIELEEVKARAAGEISKGWGGGLEFHPHMMATFIEGKGACKAIELNCFWVVGGKETIQQRLIEFYTVQKA